MIIRNQGIPDVTLTFKNITENLYHHADLSIFSLFSSLYSQMTLEKWQVTHSCKKYLALYNNCFSKHSLESYRRHLSNYCRKHFNQTPFKSYHWLISFITFGQTGYSLAHFRNAKCGKKVLDSNNKYCLFKPQNINL